MAVLLRSLGIAGALAGICVGAPVWAQSLTVVSTGGALQDAQRQVYFAPFAEASGAGVHDESWAGGIGMLRTRGESGSREWDLVLVSGDEMLLGCDEGLFEKLDWARIGGKDRYVPIGVSDCGVGAIQAATVLAWDRDKMQATPSWGDFWDIAKYPGKRGLRQGPRTNLEIALMADGVAPGDVYKVLRTDDGVERAFRKLDQLKPYIVWWRAPGDAARILASGEVLMTSAQNGAVAAAARAQSRHFGMQWSGSLAAVESWAVLKGTAHLDDAYRLLDFMGDPKREAALFALIPYPGLAKGATDNASPDMLALSPASPANQQNALKIDQAFWRDNLDKLTQRFNAWLAAH
jgi:putative spermidine/putrescine transport system substrate-binding protein